MYTDSLLHGLGFRHTTGGYSRNDASAYFFIPTSIASCLSSQFICTNRNCIDQDGQCDHYNNCGDNSDEIGCGKLPFLLVLMLVEFYVW